jgi:hypothetical protein
MSTFRWHWCLHVNALTTETHYNIDLLTNMTGESHPPLPRPNRWVLPPYPHLQVGPTGPHPLPHLTGGSHLSPAPTPTYMWVPPTPTPYPYLQVGPTHRSSRWVPSESARWTRPEPTQPRQINSSKKERHGGSNSRPPPHPAHAPTTHTTTQLV